MISIAACAARGVLSALITSRSLGWSIVYKVVEDFLLVQIEMFLRFFGLLTHVWMIVMKNYPVLYRILALLWKMNMLIYLGNGELVTDLKKKYEGNKDLTSPERIETNQWKQAAAGFGKSWTCWLPWAQQVSIFYIDNSKFCLFPFEIVLTVLLVVYHIGKLSITIRLDAECIICCSALPLYKEMVDNGWQDIW